MRGTSVLIPWATCAAPHAPPLPVSTPLHSPVAWWGQGTCHAPIHRKQRVGPLSRWLHQTDNHPPLIHTVYRREGEREILSSVILIAGPSLLICGPRRPRRLNKGQHHQLPGDEMGRAGADMPSLAADMSIPPGALTQIDHSSLAGPPTRSGRAQAFRSRNSRRFSGTLAPHPATHPSIHPAARRLRCDPVLLLRLRGSSAPHVSTRTIDSRLGTRARQKNMPPHSFTH